MGPLLDGPDRATVDFSEPETDAESESLPRHGAADERRANYGARLAEEDAGAVSVGLQYLSEIVALPAKLAEDHEVLFLEEVGDADLQGVR